MATTIVDTLITKVVFDNDTTGLDAATSSIGSFKTQVVGILAPVVALFSGGLFINSIANSADEMIKFADATGVAVDALQDLEFAAERQGGTVDGLRRSIESLAEKTGEAAALGSGEAVPVFEALGISARKSSGEIKTSTEIMLELNEAFQDLSKAEQISFSKKLGIDAGTLRLLQTAPRELEALIAQSKEFGRVSEAEARQAAAFNDELTNISTQFGRMAQSIGLAVLPAITDLLKSIQDITTFISANMEFFSLFVDIVGVAAGALLLLSRAFQAAAAASIASAAAFLVNPIFLIPAAIIAVSAALALLIDDFRSFQRGTDSVIGRFVEKFQNAAKIISSVWSRLTDPIFGSIDEFLDKISSLGNAFTSFQANVVGDLFGDDAPEPIVNLLKNNAPEPIVIGGGNSTSSVRTTTVGEVSVTVNAPGADSQEIATNVGVALNKEVRAAAEDFDSGIKR